MTHPWPTLMPMGIVVISCVRPSVQPSMGLRLCIAYKALGRNGLQFGMLMYPDGLHSAFNTLVDTGDICCHYWQHILVSIYFFNRFILTHRSRVTHICVSKLTITGSDNNNSNAGILLIGPVGTNFSEILIEIYTFSFKKMRLKISSAKWWPFCLRLNVLSIIC